MALSGRNRPQMMPAAMPASSFRGRLMPFFSVAIKILSFCVDTQSNSAPQLEPYSSIRRAEPTHTGWKRCFAGVPEPFGLCPRHERAGGAPIGTPFLPSDLRETAESQKWKQAPLFKKLHLKSGAQRPCYGARNVPAAVNGLPGSRPIPNWQGAVSPGCCVCWRQSAQ